LCRVIGFSIELATFQKGVQSSLLKPLVMFHMNAECLIHSISIEVDHGTSNHWMMSSDDSLEAGNPLSILASNSCE